MYNIIGMMYNNGSHFSEGALSFARNPAESKFASVSSGVNISFDSGG